MQEGLNKIIEDATSIEGDGFENMDMVIDTLVLTNTTISCIISKRFLYHWDHNHKYFQIQHFTVIHRAYQNVVKMSKQLSNDKQNFVIDR